MKLPILVEHDAGHIAGLVVDCHQRQLRNQREMRLRSSAASGRACFRRTCGPEWAARSTNMPAIDRQWCLRRLKSQLKGSV